MGEESKIHTACVVLVHSAAPIFVVASEGVETSVVRGNVVEHAGAGWAVQRLLSVGCPEIDLGPTDRLLLEGTGHNLRPSHHTVRGKPVKKGRKDRHTEWQTDKPTRRHADTNTRTHADTQPGRHRATQYREGGLVLADIGEVADGADPIAGSVRFAIDAVGQCGVMVETHLHGARAGGGIAQVELAEKADRYSQRQQKTARNTYRGAQT